MSSVDYISVFKMGKINRNVPRSLKFKGEAGGFLKIDTQNPTWLPCNKTYQLVAVKNNIICFCDT